MKTKIKNNPDILPAFAHDYGNYVARYGMGNFQIQFIIKFDSKIEFDKLKKAVRLSVDAEPVLGCKFVEHNPPYWKRLDDLDNVEFCTMVETQDIEKAVLDFLESPMNMDHDPMVKLKLIRSSDYDTLVIKLNHTCGDGGGTRDFILLLSDIYSRIEAEDSDYVPIPSVRSSKDHKRAFSTLGIKHPELDNSTVESPRTIWPFPWKSGGHKNSTSFVICQLSDLDELSKYAKSKGATINDLLLTAFYRAMFKMSHIPYGIPMDIGLTVDLRRYLPNKKAEAIRNFSGGVILRLARLFHEPFEGTLARVVSIMNRKKIKKPGYQSATGAERIERINFHQFVAFSKFASRASEITSKNCFYCSPGLSNIGLVSKSLIKFGEIVVTEAYFIPPVVKSPGFLVVASGYDRLLTLSVGYYKGSIADGYFEKLLNKIRSELIEGCKVN